MKKIFSIEKFTSRVAIVFYDDSSYEKVFHTKLKEYIVNENSIKENIDKIYNYFIDENNKFSHPTVYEIKLLYKARMISEQNKKSLNGSGNI